ncbi:hypothetical protein [Fulvivirga sedimenti]|uniref:Type 1 periplasmic binding fold superfamily protein n=1 Tax=Fulvivirga sedimenti TaxID=2879465 RepID=A0A9X1HR82_9BACT|nr:hypothetical protein [Fulvivirga sedimenti]MCA6075503.1 hypothetical protein [Fulvivirga sedimenti]MCA6076680.1 hypothetical protein [Fulvivirga sedimenti]MCA6077808.1 hypothetical protein [Fulvivirga sedimenti]
MTRLISFFVLSVMLFAFTGCGDDDVPPVENVEEEITQVLLTFTNTQDAGDVVTAEWLDADGEGGNAPTVDDVVLDASKSYSLSIEFFNTLETPAEDITEEVSEEADEHMIFFGFSETVFANPDGNGNIDSRADAVNYDDEDTNGLPLGLLTSWTTSDVASTGTFRVVLKHQPGLKTATSTSADGETDVDVTFPLILQ